jgi:hypothetical protein
VKHFVNPRHLIGWHFAQPHLGQRIPHLVLIDAPRAVRIY